MRLHWDIIGLTCWLAWGLCGALTEEDTYLTASERWQVSYNLSQNVNCGAVSPNHLHPTTLKDAKEVVERLMKDHPDCMIHVWVEAYSNVTHPGIVVDQYRNRSPVAALGSKTAAKIFGISPGSFWSILVDKANSFGTRFGKQFVIRAGLDDTEATFMDPAEINSWITPNSSLLWPDTKVAYSGLPKSLHGPFQIASRDYKCSLSPCESETVSTNLTFYTVLQEETTFIKARDAWNVSFEVVPLCAFYYPDPDECKRVGTMTEVERCVDLMSDCTVEILATLKQTKAYDGLIYDSKNSSTPGARIGIEAIQRLLPRLEPEEFWRLIEVGFEGRDHSDKMESERCLRGSHLAFRLLNRASDDVISGEATLPTNTNPVDFDVWWYTDKFNFVPGKIEYESVTAPGLYRNVVDGSMELSNPWDIDMAVRQQPGRTCEWRQTGCTVKLSLTAGNIKSDYLTEKNNWTTRYVLEKGDNCQIVVWPINCSDVAAGGNNLQTCVDEIVKADPTCTFDIRVELTQEIGFDGIVVGEEGNSAPIIAIGRNITSKAFTSPLKDYPSIYLRDVLINLDIKGTGNEENECDAEGSKDRMVSRNFLDAELPTPQKPANFSNDTWHDAPFVSNLVDKHVVATLDPKADFSLATHLLPGRGCVTRQRGAQLRLVIPVHSRSEELMHAADTWQIEYKIGGTQGCSHDPCALIPSPRAPGSGEVATELGFRSCARIISENMPNCKGNMTIWAHQVAVYPGLATARGSTGAFALTPAALRLIERAVRKYPMKRISLDFGGIFLNCKLNQSKVLFFPEYNISTLNLKTGRVVGFHSTDSVLFTADDENDPVNLIQAGTYVLKAPRPDCAWPSTAGRIVFEPSEEVKFGTLFEN